MQDRPTPADVFLSPHTDDICFSLGVLASQRGSGQLLTVFPRSTYQVRALSLPQESSTIVTHNRISEDSRFAQTCGLDALYLGFDDSSARGSQPFDPEPVRALAATIAPTVVAALMGPLLGKSIQPKPLLACPVGIGGHVDHLAVCRVVIGHLQQLELFYRVGFYEDLPYACEPTARMSGLQKLASLLGERQLRRFVVPLDTVAQDLKLRLVSLYESQLTPRLRSLSGFTPAASATVAPHEAIWMLQPAMNQSSG